MNEGKKTPSPHRPPPLDLTKTKMMYPSKPARPEQSSRTPKAPPKKVDLQKDDPFQGAEVEPGHRYTPWTRKVDVKPGQIVPLGVLGSHAPMKQVSRETLHEAEEMYGGVLHNILLTPTYLNASPATASPFNVYTKRRTILDRAADTIHHVARHSRRVTKGHEDGARPREMKMQTFGKVKPLRLDEGIGKPYLSTPGDTRAYPRRSPGYREWTAEGAMYVGEALEKDGEKDWEKRKGDEKQGRKRQRIWKVCLASSIRSFR